MNDCYKTVVKRGLGFVEDRGSRFYSVIDRTSKRPAFDALLSGAQSHYPDATHHCWAFRIGIDDPDELSSDAGEPSGSAGLPILRVLSGAELVNIACVVSRYFGGTKLGVGGLIRAYSSAASGAVENAKTEEVPITAIFEVVLEYRHYAEFEGALKRMGGRILDAKFAESVAAKYEIPKSIATDINGFLASISHGTAIAKEVQ